MKANISIIQYFPDTNREEGFGIGLILSSGNLSLVKVSSERIKRINTAYGLDKSKLIELAIDDITNKTYSAKSLEYLSVYENGNIRYSTPQILETENLEHKFLELYSKYAADYYEDEFIGKVDNSRKFQSRLGSSLRKIFQSNSVLNSKLNIGYNFKNNSISKFLIGNPNIDFIGGNGTVFSGEIINLDLNEESLQRSLNKTITMFEALDKSFSNMNRFDAKDCKLLVLEEQAMNPEKAEYMEILNTWHVKAGYDLIVKPELKDFEETITEVVNKKNIIRFDDWLNNIQQA